jgi:glycosyltransferase involved in cell wall biosynthesis
MPDRAPAPVSVIVPAFNAELFLAGALASIARQSILPAEVIVVDDASSDRTAEIAMQHGARVFTFERNRGPAAARNAGARIAVQPWIAFLDADDRWLDGKLAAQWNALERWPDAGFCFSDYDVVHADGSTVSAEMAGDAGFARLRVAERLGRAARFAPDTVVDGLIRSMFVRQSSVVMKRDIFLGSGGYDESLRLAEDYEFFIRIAGLAPTVAVEEALVVYQRRTGSLSADPLAEVRSIDALWESMLSRPDRYPATTLSFIKAARVPTLHRGTARALRLGRFAEAKPFADKAFGLENSLASLAWCAATRLLDNPAGAGAHRIVRAAWRARAISQRERPLTSSP